ncbi:MAG: nitroreductase family protein [Cyclobacteriaceae bacterium]|nr:nitroreductase family protein [Cyclobacteriaceae bacterium]
MEKTAQPEHPVADLIRNRKSPRAIQTTPVEAEKIKSLFEAVRWTPSSNNEQPWKYIYATRDQPLWELIFQSINESNQIWAKNAPLLIMSMTRKTFTRYGVPNEYAHYDLGAANSFLSLQAVELGLQVRQMAGYSTERMRHNLNIPDDYDLGALIAVGYPGNPDELPEKLRLRELAPRERLVQQEFVLNRPF